MTKNVLITGGTQGIGEQTALEFAKNGYDVIVTSRNASKEKEVQDKFQNKGYKVTFYTLDVNKESQVKEVIESIVEKFGKLDVLVNNSGISLGNALLADTESEEFTKMLDTNVSGVYYGMKYAIKAMEKTGGGSIVNLASIAGLNGLQYSALYGATKHAVVGLTKGGAVDYADKGIRINAIAPGAIKTDILQNAIDSGTYDEASIAAIHPMKKLGDPTDIAKGIYFLADDNNPFLTGTILNIDGGYTAQ